MRIRPPLHLLLLAGLGTGITACSESTLGLVCTEIGCSHGVTVSMEESLADGTVISLLLDDAPWTVTCGEDVDCSRPLFFEGLRAEQLRIRVTTPTAVAHFDFEPEYELFKPNGPDCPPDCFQAEITLPALGGG